MLLTVFTIIGYIVIVATFFYAFYYAANTFLEKTGTLQVLNDYNAIKSKACLKPGSLTSTIDDQLTADQEDKSCLIM